MTWKLLAAIGLAVVALAGWLAYREHVRLRSSQIVVGTVAKIDYTPGSGKSPGSYTPHVRYTTRGGTEREFLPYRSGEAGVEINQSVVVAYEDATQDVRLVTFGGCYGWVTFLAVFGVTLVLLGAAFLVGRQFVPQVYVDHPFLAN